MDGIIPGLSVSIGHKLLVFNSRYHYFFQELKNYCNNDDVLSDYLNNIHIIITCEYDIVHEYYSVPICRFSNNYKITLISLLIIMIFHGRMHSDNIFSLDETIYYYLESLSKYFDHDLKMLFRSNLQRKFIKQFYDRIYFSCTDDIKRLFNLMDEYSFLRPYKFTRMQEYEVTHYDTIKINLHIENQTRLETKEIIIGLTFKDMIDPRTNQVVSKYLVSQIFDELKKQYESNLINVIDVDCYDMPTIELFVNNIFKKYCHIPFLVNVVAQNNNVTVKRSRDFNE